MLRVLIVDDEYVERAGIERLIRDLCLPLAAHTVEDGEAAYAYLLAHPDVDILITDIKMPFMDGLTLTEKALVLNPDLQVLIYSAYEEFALARRALRLDVADYLVKPINRQEFATVVTRMIDLSIARKEKKNRERGLPHGHPNSADYEREHLLRSAAEGTIAADRLAAMLVEAGVDWVSETRLVLVYSSRRVFDVTPTALDAPALCQSEAVSLNERECLIYLHGFHAPVEREALDRIFRQWIDKLEIAGAGGCIVIVSKSIHASGEYAAAYRQLREQLDNQMFYHSDGVIHMDDAGLVEDDASIVCMKLGTEIVSALQESDYIYSLHTAKNLFDLAARSSRISAMYFRYICANILRQISRKQSQSGGEGLEDILDRLMTTSDLAVVRKTVIEELEGLAHANESSLRKIAQRIVRIVKDIIETEYAKDISLEYIAGKTSRSPAYISSLFKNETGQNLVKYLTAYRMQKAADLLRQTNYKITRIASEVGYLNASYFCHLFKGAYGLPPGMYRQEYRE